MKPEDYTTTDEDSRLVSLCRKGDMTAFEELVRRHENMMLNTAYRLIGSYEESCDIVQDAFVIAYREIKNFKGMSRFSTWLSTIVINLSKKRHNRMRTRRFYEPVSIDEPVETGGDRMKIEPRSSDPAADEIIEKREIQEKVQLCLERLNAEFREVIVLKDVQEFSYEEIVGILNIADGTVKSRLFRAKANLRNCLKKMGVGLNERAS